MSSEQAEGIKKIADATGKADWVLDLELKDEQGNICCFVHCTFQMRRS
jgi:hypothetical protein